MLREGEALDEALKRKIRDAIRREASPRHVPEKIVAVPAVPYTLNGKKVEIAVAQVIHGEEVKNREALANPEALECYRDLEKLKS